MFEKAHMVVSPKNEWLKETIRENELDCKNDFLSNQTIKYRDWSIFEKLGYKVIKIKIEENLGEN